MDTEHDTQMEVQQLSQLDYSSTSEFQHIVELAANICEKPVALITLLDENFETLKVKSGVNLGLMPKGMSFCKFGITQPGVYVIPDTGSDPRFSKSPLMEADPEIRFYAGVPLTLSNGIKVGTLCLFDLKPNTLTEVQRQALVMLGRQVTFLMELEVSRKQLQRQIEETEARNGSLTKIAQLQSHQIRQPLTSIMGLVNLIREEHQPVDETWLQMFEQATADFDSRIRTIVAESMASKDLKAIRFNKMVEEIDDYAILLLDREGNVENWNKGAEKIKGYRYEEIIGKHFSVFYTQYDKEQNRPGQLMAEAVKHGVARDEGWRVRKDGSKFWGSIVITAIHNGREDVIGFTKVTRDLTDITETRHSLSATEELYKHLVLQTNDIARVGGWEIDILTNTVSWTSVTREIHGVDPGYVPELASAIAFYKEGESRNRISAAVKQATEEGTPWDLELQLVTSQGKEVWVRAIGNSNYKDGVCTKVYGTFQDIDARKKRELALARSSRFFTDMLQANTGMCIIETDAKGTITRWNTGAQRLVGYTAEEAMGNHYPDLLHVGAEIMQRSEELSGELGIAVEGFRVLAQKPEAEGTEQREWTYRKKDGTEVMVSVVITALSNAGNTINGYLVVATGAPDTNIPVYSEAG